MGIRLVKRWGEEIENPTEDDLHAALAELSTPDQEHPDTWLIDENEYAISVFVNGLVIFGNVETGEEFSLAKPATHQEVLQLWRLLQQGDLQAIWQERWVPRQPGGTAHPATP